ncbi:hypothetical protein M9194_04255 [Vibrio sp. S4M6]|uniref:DUF7709 family protein n=1 Tax=Vibrio sinus TaxID=2946865 RepID=UPI002029B915|nr:hypothetical protein [Vibrio sinus]MCL9780648.1 hypothetical protein [Vibrio sinus]
MKDKMKVEQLSSVNQKIVADGESLPIVMFKDGTKLPTGTVATMIHNIDRYNSGERADVEQELELAIPVLYKLGLFDLFKPDEWLSQDNLGRNYIGKLAKTYANEA